MQFEYNLKNQKRMALHRDKIPESHGIRTAGDITPSLVKSVVYTTKLPGYLPGRLA